MPCFVNSLRITLVLLLCTAGLAVWSFNHHRAEERRITYLDDSGKEITPTTSLVYGLSKSIRVDGDVYETRYGKETRLKHAINNMHLAYSVEALPSGNLFVCGTNREYPDPPKSDARETSLYDVKSASATVGPPLTEARCKPSLLLLNDGRILIVGGIKTDGISTSNAIEIFDPASNTISLLGRLSEARGGAGCIQISDDKVAVIGGQTKYCLSGLVQAPTGICEIVDLKTGRTRKTAEVTPCTEPILLKLKDRNSNILVVGGYYQTVTWRDTRWKAGFDVFNPH